MRRSRRVHGSNMASFSAKSFEKKLKEMSSRQDSVQTVSLWLIHHRAHSKSVVNLWLDRMKKAKPDRRLVLFYLANDVIQNSRKKGKEFSQSFSKVLGDSMQYLRDTSIRPSVERVLKIWQERKVFEKDIVQKLLDQLNNVSAKPKPKPKPEVSAPKKENDKVKKEKKPKHPVPANFKTMNVTRAIATMEGIEDETERRQTLVNQMRLDASSSEGIKQLKDYAGGNRFSLEFEESSTKYEDLFQSLEGESQHREVLVNLLEDGDAYYQAALKEATIIANAYRSFGNRLHSMKKKLDNKIRKFATAEKEAPVSAPKASFLASGLSGILEQMNQSPAGTPSRSETEKNDDAKEGEKADGVGKEGNEIQDQAEAKEGKIVDPTVDHVEVSDMDLDSDSENGEDDTEPSAAPQLSDTNSSTSAVSTPKPVLTASAVTTPSPNVLSTPTLNTGSPSVQPKPQYGYTMTVNSTERNETSSPASHNSAPSPDGSPDLNLEIYEGPPAANALPSNQLGVMTNQSFLGGVTNEQKPGAGSPGPNTMNLLAQLINKQRRNDGSSVEGADSPGQGSNTSNTRVRDESNSRPLIDLLGNLLSPLVHSQANPVLQQGEVSQSGDQVAEGDIQQEATNVESFDPGVAPDQVESKLTDVAEAASKLDSGPSTDEEGDAGDNTPEHGLDFAQAPPIVLRSDTLFPRPPIPPNFSGPGQVFQNRPPMGRPPFVSPERMPRFPNEPGMFMRDGPRRTSIEEQLMEEQHLRSPGMRSPRMQVPPMEWERGPPFGPRGNVQPVRENRDPRLRRREMMGRSAEGPPFIDRVPPMEMRGRPPGIGHPADRDGAPTFMERQGHDIRREEMEREEMIQRRLSVGDERDGPISIEERERRIWEMGEGRPPMEIRPELHGERREGPFPFERHERGVEMRESFHPIDRDRHIDGPLPLDRREGPHPIELRDGPPHMRGDMNHPIDRRHPIHPMDRPDLPGERREPHPFDPRGPPMDRPDLHSAERREPHHFEAREPPIDSPMDRPDRHPTESHPFDQRGPPIDQLDGAHPTRGPAFDGPHPVEHQNEFHPPEMQGASDEVPTSEEELPDGEDHGDKSTVGVLPQEQNPGEVFPEGGDERPPVHIHEGPHPKMDKPEDMHNEMKFNQTEGPRQNEQLGGPMFRSGMRPQLRPLDERSMFDIRPEFHMDDRGPAFGPPGRRDDNRPIRPIGGLFGPRHEGRGRFPGPRNFHPNFGPRHFRPRHENEGGRPRFHPMHGGPRLKRPGPPFHPDPAKRPHYFNN